MGCCGCSDEVSPRVKPTTPENEEMTSRNSEQIFVTHRSCTDILALIFLLAVLGGFAYLMVNAVSKGDIFRIIYGYDNDGNVCGRITPKESNPEFSRTGADMRNYPYLLVEIKPIGIKSRTCVKDCNISSNQSYVKILNRCVPKEATDTITSAIKNLGLDNFYREISRDLGVVWKELIYLLLISLAFSLGILIAFRFMVQWIVYIVLVGVVVVCIGGTTYLWLVWNNERKAVAAKKVYEEDSSVQPYFIYAIIMSIITIITLLIILVMRKRIALVMQLFREAGKAVYSMPALLLQPVYTYILIGLTVTAWVYCMLWIESAGNIYKNSKGHTHFRKDALLVSTRWYNLFLFFVMCEFFLGCQHIVVALAVTRWYFTREKKQLTLPILQGFSFLTMYHLGTVAFGALIIGFVRLVRAILSFVQNHLKKYDNDLIKGILWCCQCCLWCFECALKFLTRNAYIETAIYGCNFCTGGRKAFQALSSNILRVAAINSVGDFVLFLGKVMVVTLTVISGISMMQKKEGLHYPWVPITLAGLIAFLVSHCFISIYEMIIDSIFLCFCEDSSKNDGISRPYFMSRGLMEFVENSKKALRHLDEQQLRNS